MNDQYLQYELSDLLTDDTFVNWVLDGTHDDQWQSWLDAHPERVLTINQARKTISNLKFKEPAIRKTTKNDLWQRIDRSTQTRVVSFSSNRRKWIYALAAAASVTLLAIFLFPDNTVIHTTDIAGTENVMLPDNSLVTLASSSSITYDETKWNTKRNIQLEGQGHFKVSKGVPFTVRTENGSVEVLGTEFDVVSTEEAFQVLVTEGKVNVSSGNHDRILTGGMAFYKNPVWKGEHGLSNDWKTDRMFFAYKEESLSNVLQAVTFYYGLPVEGDAVDMSIKYTGSFDSSDDLETSLRGILWPLNIDYKLIDEKIILSLR